MSSQSQRHPQTLPSAEQLPTLSEQFIQPSPADLSALLEGWCRWQAILQEGRWWWWWLLVKFSCASSVTGERWDWLSLKARYVQFLQVCRQLIDGLLVDSLVSISFFIQIPCYDDPRTRTGSEVWTRICPALKSNACSVSCNLCLTACMVGFYFFYSSIPYHFWDYHFNFIIWSTYVLCPN